MCSPQSLRSISPALTMAIHTQVHVSFLMSSRNQCKGVKQAVPAVVMLHAGLAGTELRGLLSHQPEKSMVQM